MRRGFRSDVNVTTADSPRSLSSPGPLEDTHTTMAAMTTTAHNYDDVKALLMPKNFDEGNAKVLPRRIISRRSSAPLHLSATQAAPPPSPYLWSSPTEEEA